MISIEHLFKILNFVANMLPAPFYWTDLQGKFLGINSAGLKALNAPSDDSVIGKTVYEVYNSKSTGDVFLQDIKQVISTGTGVSREDKSVDIVNGNVRYFLTVKAPLLNFYNEVVGVICTSIEVTSEKEAEQLRLENEANRVIAHEQTKFKEIVRQLNHDIRSPLMSLQMLNKKCSNILPEHERNAYVKAIGRITDITNNIANYFKSVTQQKDAKQWNRPILVTTELLELITEKKYEYNDRLVTFSHYFSQDSNFAFIDIESGVFKRIISNVINKSMKAIGNKLGKITIYLEKVDGMINIIVQDDGKALSKSVREKILVGDPLFDSVNSDTIGFVQIKQIVLDNHGMLIIESKRGYGNKVYISFPQVASPDWIAQKINIYSDELLIVLDDDPSIHVAWDIRLKNEAPSITVKHFEVGEDTVSFINSLNPAQKLKVLLLADYELIKQGITGLDVIKKTGIGNAILVTGYSDDPVVLKQSVSAKTKILPKLLAPEVPIVVHYC